MDLINLILNCVIIKPSMSTIPVFFLLWMFKGLEKNYYSIKTDKSQIKMLQMKIIDECF